ncbi:MAG: hypothetical protein K1X83_05455 [Oligoflexia bacterium]|nr:hypothetical protein [Oligoflexia bacterium]
MTKKIGDKKKVGEVTSTNRATEVEGTQAVGNVQGIKPTSAIGGVTKAGGIGKRGATRSMTMAEREELLRLIEEEAEDMFGKSASNANKQKVVNAVKMAVDIGLMSAQEATDPKSKK